MKKRDVIILIMILLFIIAITFSIFYYKNKVYVSFETGTDENILTQYVKKGKTITEPIAPSKDGYIFIEWQLNGERYDFNTPVNTNFSLTAKWIKKEYITITYDVDSTYSIEPIKILKGTSIKNLQDAYKDGYVFDGWYIGDKKYNGEVLNSNTCLTARYTKKQHIYKVGDSIIITGKYSSSAYSSLSEYDAAIGWQRYILNILEDTNYPYVIGNQNGVTGFFNSDSIKLEGE